MSANSPPYGVGIIGCGWAASAHARGYLFDLGLFDVRMCCDTNAAKAAECSALFPHSEPVEEWKAVVESPRVDVVDICLPHHLHHAVTIAAAEAGKHVLIEKPLARSLREGREMVDAVERAGVVLMVAFNERFTWQARKIREIVDSGRIGDVYFVRTDHNQDTSFSEAHWWRSSELVGGGALIGSGVHMLDLLRWFGGEASDVYCATHIMPARLAAEIAASVSLTFANGGLGSLDITWAAPGEPWCQFLIVYGTEGRITSLGRQVVLATGTETETWQPPENDPAQDSFTQEVLHFGTCLRDGVTPMTSARDALKTQELVEAAYRSVAERRPVGMPI
jgi:predicted dehydrogenase